MDVEPRAAETSTPEGQQQAQEEEQQRQRAEPMPLEDLEVCHLQAHRNVIFSICWNRQAEARISGQMWCTCGLHGWCASL